MLALFQARNSLSMRPNLSRIRAIGPMSPYKKKLKKNRKINGGGRRLYEEMGWLMSAGVGDAAIPACFIQGDSGESINDPRRRISVFPKRSTKSALGSTRMMVKIRRTHVRSS